MYVFMYKTAVYTLVNGVITHQKQQISKMWYYAAWHCLSVNVLLSNITFLCLICCFWCVMTLFTGVWSAVLYINICCFISDFRQMVNLC